MLPPPGDEEKRNDVSRFDHAAWLTLIIGLSWFVFVPALMLVNFNFPSDGWTDYKVQQSGGYIIGMNVTGKPSPLQTGDLIVAINGQPYQEDPLPPVPAHPQLGQVIHYTVQRNGHTLSVDVTLVRRDALALWRGFVQRWQNELSSLLSAFISFLVAAFTFAARPRNRAGQYLFLIFSFFCAALWFGFTDWHPYVYTYPFLLRLVNFFFTFAWAWYFFPTWTLLALTLPVLKTPLRRMSRLLPALLYAVPFAVILITTSFMLATNKPVWVNLAFGMFMVMLAIMVGAVLGSLVHNWLIVREPVVRAQLRWITLGLGVGWGLGTLGSFLFNLLWGPSPYGGLWEQISTWLSLLLPISLGIAITRYRLFDIDIIIRRTLVYSTLTLTLGLVYVGCIVVSRGLVAPLTGGSEVAIVASTLAIAALFNPLRRRIQAVIDKRFYRRKYDAAKVLAAFGATARDETDLERLTDELLHVVDETMRPEFVSLWLRDTPAQPRNQADRSPPSPT